MATAVSDRTTARLSTLSSDPYLRDRFVAAERDDGLVMALLTAVRDQESATERVALLTGELAKRRGVALLVE